MKKQFTEEQIARVLTRLKKGERATDLGHELGVSDKTLYNWRARFKDMTLNEQSVFASWKLKTLN